LSSEKVKVSCEKEVNPANIFFTDQRVPHIKLWLIHQKSHYHDLYSSPQSP